MGKHVFIMLVCLCLAQWASAQKYFSKTGKISFLSEAPIEKIEAYNNNAFVVVDAASGMIEASVLIKGFKFEKAMMQEHFNENYMESNKYPKAVLKGHIDNISALTLDKDGDYAIHIKGDLTLHGVTKHFSSPAKLTVKGGNFTAHSEFDLVIADFGIVVPKVVRDNIAKTVKVTVHADLQKM